MKPRYRIAAAILIVLGGITLYSHRAAFSWTAKSNGPPVSLASATPQNVTVVLSTIGQIQPVSTVSITPQVSGKLIQTNFAEGSLVQKNQLLFQIDPRPYQALLAQAKGQLAKDNAQLSATQLLSDRSLPLLKKGYLAKQDFDQVQANTLSQKALVQSDQAQLQQAQLNLDNCTITAPITGRTGNLLINTGNIVSPDKSLVTINQLQPIYASFSVPENQLSQIKLSVPVRATLPHTQETGNLVFINNIIDISTGTLQLKALFNNTDLQLWPGQFVTIQLPLEHMMQALIVPTVSLQDGQNGPYVYVFNPVNKTVIYRPVKTGPEVPQGTVIISGLNAGDKVVTAGQLRLNNGMRVNVQ